MNRKYDLMLNQLFLNGTTEKEMRDSELILNDDGSVYHLNVRPEHLADTIILVGDPGRVEQVSSYFDSIEHRRQNREFKTHTGTLNGKQLTVLSTGIGTDNIDITINELDAAVNIDLETLQIKPNKKSLNLIRIGTSGALQENIPIGTHLISEYALGFDGLLHYYNYPYSKEELEIGGKINQHLAWNTKLPEPYLVKSSKVLLNKLGGSMTKGITATASGFYGPQGRKLRLDPSDKNINERLTAFKYNEHRITNFEMETSALYGLGRLLGHNCITCCAIIANRIRKEYSEDHLKDVKGLIESVLNKLT